MEKLQLFEEKIFALLSEYAIDTSSRENEARLIAKKSVLMNHLYYDLGFKNRKEMHAFMTKHFPSLAAKKPKEKLWKKYLYDLIGEIAPACYECGDQDGCFKCTLV